MPFRDHYQILEVAKTASQAEIKAAYRRLSKKYHPDLNGGEKIFEEKFKEIQRSYEVLSDPYIKAIYDDRFNTLRPSPSFTGTTEDLLSERRKAKAAQRQNFVASVIQMIVMAIIGLLIVTSQMKQTYQFVNFSFLRGGSAHETDNKDLRPTFVDPNSETVAKQECMLSGRLSPSKKEKGVFLLDLSKPIQFTDATTGFRRTQKINLVQVQDTSGKTQLSKYAGKNVTIKCTLVTCVHITDEPPVMTSTISDVYFPEVH